MGVNEKVQEFRVKSKDNVHGKIHGIMMFNGTNGTGNSDVFNAHAL